MPVTAFSPFPLMLLEGYWLGYIKVGIVCLMINRGKFLISEMDQLRFFFFFLFCFKARQQLRSYWAHLLRKQ